MKKTYIDSFTSVALSANKIFTIEKPFLSQYSGFFI